MAISDTVLITPLDEIIALVISVSPSALERELHESRHLASFLLVAAARSTWRRSINRFCLGG